MRRFLLVCLFCFNYQVVSCLVNECLIRVLDDSNGLMITTSLKSGHEQAYTFPELHLACTSISYKCQELAILEPATANSTEAISAAMVDNGILLLKFFYLDLEQPIVKLISNFTLDLGPNCMPLALMTHDFFPSDYLIACATNDYEFQLRQLFIDRTNIEVSRATILFRANGLIIFTGGNFSLLSNFIPKPNEETLIFFAYGSTLYEIHIDILLVSGIGQLHDPSIFICDYARRLAFDPTDKEVIFMKCPDGFVQFSLGQGRLKNPAAYNESRDLLCPRESATIFPANSTVSYQNRNIQLPGLRPTGNGECFGELDQQYFVYEGAGSSILLADLAKDAVAKLSNNPCGSDQILIIDNRYVAVTESGNQECSTILYDSRNEESIDKSLIMSTGPYTTLGVVDYFMRNRRDESDLDPGFNFRILGVIAVPFILVIGIIVLVICIIFILRRSNNLDSSRRTSNNSNVVTGGSSGDGDVELKSIQSTPRILPSGPSSSSELVTSPLSVVVHAMTPSLQDGAGPITSTAVSNSPPHTVLQTSPNSSERSFRSDDSSNRIQGNRSTYNYSQEKDYGIGEHVQIMADSGRMENEINMVGARYKSFGSKPLVTDSDSHY